MQACTSRFEPFVSLGRHGSGFEPLVGVRLGHQADSFPPELRAKLTVIHDGIDTARVRPHPAATLTLPGGAVLRAGDEVLSYVSRSLEPYRGFHMLMRALPRVLAERPREVRRFVIDAEACRDCGACLRTGCPALEPADGFVRISEALCRGCGLCAEMCRFGAVREVQCP